MEYLSRSLKSLKDYPDFNFHPRCERLGITNLCFADDLMLFTRGDRRSVELIMEKFEDFSKSTGLKVNKSKCCLFVGGVTPKEEEEIIGITGYCKGKLPFKYLGIPLDSKKITVNKCLQLIDKITERMRHWATRLLTYAGRLQLIKSVMFGITAYWMNVFPLPKAVLNHIEALCRTFLWTGKEIIGKNAPVAWKKICEPKNAGGLDVTDLHVWKKAICLKLLWSLSMKEEKLWIKWMHSYFFKGKGVMEVQIKSGCSWLMKSILKSRQMATDSDLWNKLEKNEKFPTKKIYRELQGVKEEVGWRSLFFNNEARPRAKFITWLACHERLSTKDRLRKFGIANDDKCCYCDEAESISHLFFDCVHTRKTWLHVLNWLQVKHLPGGWTEEMRWIIKASKGDRSKCRVLKCAFAETIYHVWRERNEKIFQQSQSSGEYMKRIIEVVAVRCGKKEQKFLMKLDGRE